jgi:hypothetical protein
MLGYCFHKELKVYDIEFYRFQLDLELQYLEIDNKLGVV